ncbi:MAG: D-tyrosyl-tRNA(Tyr) deacylase [Bacilli bacterium]|jgi:D-tyrosyl-tRNA(Tyr) deacylase|nr:D-tyrosyl-tRNA(Tyr) deacylase [Bacilli bacterium]
MRVVVQRSKNSKVTIDGKVNGQIDHGYVLLVGFTEGDNEQIIDKMINKIVNLRIFEDENEKMNLSILDTKGSILSISQFTLYANCTEGRRPSFVEAMNPTEASRLYDVFNEKLREFLHVETGIFGADMKVEIYNDGPVTICLDSDVLFKKGVK